MTDAPLISAFQAEVIEGNTSARHDLIAGDETVSILALIFARVSKTNVYYRILFCENPGRVPVVSYNLGRQTDLEEMPYVQLILHTDATLLTVEQRFHAYQEQQRHGALR